jgi:hypothetical protein
MLATVSVALLAALAVFSTAAALRLAVRRDAEVGLR